nr:protein FAR1-RELATED SEQUENCE 5-like [Triticum aestivum]
MVEEGKEKQGAEREDKKNMDAGKEKQGAGTDQRAQSTHQAVLDPYGATMFGSQANLPVNLGAHTSVGEYNQVSAVLQPPNDMYMITGRYSVSSEDPFQAHAGGGAQHTSEVDDQHDIDLEPFVDNRFSESLNDLNWDNEMQTEAGGNKNGSMVSNEIASDNDSDSEDDLSLSLLQNASEIAVTTAGEQENSGTTGEVQKLTQEDILIFLENDSIEAAQSASQEVRSHHVPHVDMVFDTDDAAYNFYNEYASIAGFSVIKASRYCGKKQGGSAATRVTFKCNRSGRVIDEEEQENRKKKRRDTRQQKTGQEPYRNARKKKVNTIAIT